MRSALEAIGQPALPSHHPLQPGIRGGQFFRHLVDTGRERADLVVGIDPDPMVEVAAADDLRAGLQYPDGGDDAAGRDQPQKEQQPDRRRARDDDPREQRVPLWP